MTMVASSRDVKSKFDNSWVHARARLGILEMWPIQTQSATSKGWESMRAFSTSKRAAASSQCDRKERPVIGASQPRSAPTARREQSYLLDNAWQHARARLSLLESRLDPGTIFHLNRLGIRPGWRCLVVGAGGGSITEWLCQQTGPEGHVVATDIDTRFIDALDYPNLEVRRHDIVADELEKNAFDLVQVRGVLMHLAEPKRAWSRMVGALKSGGWLLAEDADNTSEAPLADAQEREGQLLLEYREAVRALLAASGGDSRYGRRLYTEMLAHGLSEVQVEGRLQFLNGGSPLAEFWRLTFTQFRERMLDAGLVSERQADDICQLFANPEFAFTTFTVWAAWGKRA